MSETVVLQKKCWGCSKVIDRDGLCWGCDPGPFGDRFPHTTCGEAGSYCDNDCHYHEHDTLRDGSVLCYKECDLHGCKEVFRESDDQDFCPKHREVCLACEERACECPSDNDVNQEPKA